MLLAAVVTVWVGNQVFMIVTVPVTNPGLAQNQQKPKMWRKYRLTLRRRKKHSPHRLSARALSASYAPAPPPSKNKTCFVILILLE
jgi:hypothetical protein